MKKTFYLFLFLFAQYISVTAQPNKIWATYYGDGLSGPGTNAFSVLYDSSGYIYVAGYAYDSSINLATPNSFKTHQTGFSDAYLAKFDTLGNRIWSTYIGNNQGDLQPYIALDPAGNIIVASTTTGDQNTIATSGTFQPNIDPFTLINSNGQSGYLMKFDPGGNRLWGTYLYIDGNMGPNKFNPNSVTTDNLGNILVCGFTLSTFPFPSSNAFMTTAPQNSNMNGFLIKISPTGSFLWGTYYGGENADACNYVACNSANEIYLVGSTASLTGIASIGAAYPDFSGGPESFVAKFNSDGSRVWGTYTNGIFVTGGIAVDTAGDFYLVGTTTRDTGIATPNTYQVNHADSMDACLSRWTPNGEKIWGTYYGGLGRDLPANFYYFGNNISLNLINQTSNISLDPSGNILIAGFTRSQENIRFGCTYLSSGDDPQNGYGFLAKFYPDGNIMWGSYYDIRLSSIACAHSGSSFYIVTTTHEDSLSTLGAFQPLKTNGANAGFISKMEGDYICPELNTNILNDSGHLSVIPGYINYKWYHNGTLLNGSNSNEYATTDTGNYWVTFTNGCDCNYSSDTIHVTKSDGTGVFSNFKNDLNINLYPNPVDGILHLKGNLQGANQKLSYEIMDVLGKIVAKSSFDVRGYIFDFTIDCSDFNSGVYFIRIQGDKSQSVLKFIKE